MCGKCLALCIFPLIVSSSLLRSNFMSDATTTRNYEKEKDSIWYNLHENSTKDYSDIHYTYSNFMSNNQENSDMIQYKFQTHDSQISVEPHINSTEIGDKKNFMSQEIHGLKGIKGENDSMYDFFRNFNRANNKNNTFPHKMCDNFTCIRLCCPFGNHLVNGRCTSMYGIAEQGNFIFLENIYGYFNDSLQNESKRIEELFFLVVHDPCQKAGHFLLNPSYNTFFLANGSLYLPYYNTIIESTSYCLAVVDSDIFAVNVCFERMKKIIKKTANYNKDEINLKSTNKNLKNIKGKSESTLYEYFNSNTNNNQNNTIPYKMCDNITCIRLCCPFGNRLVNGKCIVKQGNFIFLRNMYGYINDSLQNESKDVDKLFLLTVHDPCKKTGHYEINPLIKTVFFLNGSLYLNYYNAIIESTSYCLANVAHDKFTVNVCSNIMKEIMKTTKQNESIVLPTNTIIIIFWCCQLGIILSLLMMFIVYSIVPELRNIHGFVLQRYSGLTFVACTLVLTNVIKKDAMGNFICFTCGFIQYYAFLGSYFWLNVMSFDMWYTFRQSHSFQRKVKQQENKMLIIYSIYGWGGPFIFTIILVIVTFIPATSKFLFQAEYSVTECSFADNMALLLYFYGVVIIFLISNICLCICTARNIMYYEKDIANYLKNSKDQRYNDRKQWLKSHLEINKMLFITISIKTYMTVNAFYINISYTVTYTFLALNFIQQFCVFIIFVWNRKIRQLLLKRFGCQNHSIFSANQHTSESSNNCTTTE